MVKTINQSYQEQYFQEKKRKIFKKVFLFLVLFLIVFGGALYALFFSNFFKVREISITANGFAGHTEVRSLTEKYLAEKKFFVPKFSNIFLVSSDRIGALISEQFPAVENIRVEKKYWHGLEILLDQKKAVGVWCYQSGEQCVYFDWRGIGFDLAGETTGTLLLNVDDQKGNFKKLGELVVEQNFLDLIFQANEQLKKSQVAVSKFFIPAEEDFRLDFQTTEGWKVYLNTKDDLTKQLSNLDLFLAQKITPEKRSRLIYVDLTVPNRVYYQ